MRVVATEQVTLKVAIRCQAVEVARKMSTVWRAVATDASGGYGASDAEGSHPLPSGGSSEENVHRLANGGYG